MRKKRRKKMAQRDTQTYRKRNLLSPNLVLDGRYFHPDPYPYTMAGTPAKMALRKPKTHKKYRDPTLDTLSFVNPNKVSICQKRRKRRENLFAKQKIGRGKGSKFLKKPRRRNEFSDVRC